MFRCLTVLTAILALTAGVRAATLAEVTAARDAGDFVLLRKLVRAPYGDPAEAREILLERLWLADFNSDLPELESALAEFAEAEGFSETDRLWQYYYQSALHSYRGDNAARRRILSEAEAFFEVPGLPADLEIVWLDLRARDALDQGDFTGCLKLAERIGALPAESTAAILSKLGAEIDVLKVENYLSGVPDAERYRRLRDDIAARVGPDHPFALYAELAYLSNFQSPAKDELQKRIPEIEAILNRNAPDSYTFHADLPMAEMDLAFQNGDVGLFQKLLEETVRYWQARMPESSFFHWAFVSQWYYWASSSEQRDIAADFEKRLPGDTFLEQYILRSVLADHYREASPAEALKLLQLNLAEARKLGEDSLLRLAAEYAMVSFLYECKLGKAAERRAVRLLEDCRAHGNAPGIIFMILKMMGDYAYGNGDYAGAAERLKQAAAALEQFNQAETVRACNILISLGFAEEQLGDYAAAREAFGRAQRIVEGNAPHLDSWTIPAEQLERLKNR